MSLKINEFSGKNFSMWIYYSSAVILMTYTNSLRKNQRESQNSIDIAETRLKNPLSETQILTWIALIRR